MHGVESSHNLNWRGFLILTLCFALLAVTSVSAQGNQKGGTDHLAALSEMDAGAAVSGSLSGPQLGALPPENVLAAIRAEQELQGGGQRYYYYEGNRIPLTIEPGVVAVRFAATAESVRATALSRMLQSSDISQLVQNDELSYTLVFFESSAQAQTSIQRLNQIEQFGAEVLWVNPVFTVPGGLAVLTDEFIARFPTSWSIDQIRAYNSSMGVETVSALLSNDNTYLLRVSPAQNESGQQWIDALTMANYYQESGQVLYAEPNFSNHLERLQAPQFTPNDPYYGQQWFLNNTGQVINGVAAGSADADIDAPEAWNTTRGSSSILIAIVDDAFDATHEDLGAGTSKLVPGYDSFNGVGGVFPIPGATEGHGTSVAGAAAGAGNNGLGVSGVCSGCRLMPIRIFNAIGAATDAGIANGINYAWQNGADIISNSWGGGSPSTSITSAINSALTSGRGGKGSVVVFASGNDYGYPVIYPGNLTQVITVSASNLCDQVKTPSFNPCNYYEDWWGPNYGPEIDVAAPGVGIYTTDIMGAKGYTSGNYLPNFNGTSSATPIVSGVVGLVLSVNPNLTAVQVQSLLKANADDIHTAGFDNQTGWGRVNANRAVAAAAAAQPAPANDAATGASVVGTLPFTVSQSNIRLATATGEPTICASVTNTVWYRYTAPANQPVTISTSGSSYDTVLAAFTGSPGNLSMIRCNDDGGRGLGSTLGFDAAAGVTYYIMVGKWGSTPLTVDATLLLSVTAVPYGDTLALYSNTSNMLALIDTLQSPLPAANVTSFNTGLFTTGQFLMGDWNGDGQKTPGIYRDGAFWITDQLGPGATWRGIWIGPLNVSVVSGRFDAARANDCIGTIIMDYPTGYPMIWTCDFSTEVPAYNGQIFGQWLGTALTFATGQYQFVTGDWNGDGIDTVAIRRGPYVAYGDVPPTTLMGGLPYAQYIGEPMGPAVYGEIMAGDWDNNGTDSFGLYFNAHGRFYWYNELVWYTPNIFLQLVGTPLAGAVAESWRPYVGAFSLTMSTVTPTPTMTLTMTVTPEGTEELDLPTTTPTPILEVTEEATEPAEPPTPQPTLEPTAEPTLELTPEPTLEPPTLVPTDVPTLEPPAAAPTPEPATAVPTVDPASTAEAAGV